MLKTPGDLLAQLLHGTQEKLLIVSPFIKANALKRLLSSIGEDVSIDCVTRWRLNEVLLGVSDLEVWDLLRTRSNASLWLRMNLHAKYYRGDGNCLVGSANVTNAALGWSVAPNLELLIPAPENQDFEKELFVGAVMVTDFLYERYKAAVENCHKVAFPSIASPPMGVLENTINVNSSAEYYAAVPSIPLETWLPYTRYPETLYTAYTGQIEKLSTAAKEAAIADLAILSIPTGLDEKAFNLYVAATLIQMPLIYQVDRYVEKPQRFGAVRDLIKQVTGITKTEADTAWQTLMRWLLYFSPQIYERKLSRHSEIFWRR